MKRICNELKGYVLLQYIYDLNKIDLCINEIKIWKKTPSYWLIE